MRYAIQYNVARDDYRGNAGSIRKNLFRNLRTNFIPRGYSKFRKYNGYFYHQLYQSHLARIVKAEYPDTPIPTSALFECLQVSELPLVFDDDDEHDPVFADLFHLQGRYKVREDNTISEFFFTDQDGDVVRSFEVLDLSAIIIPIEPEPVEPDVSGINPFTWKGDGEHDAADKTEMG